MKSRRRIGSRWLVGTVVAIASVVGLAGIAAAVVSSDGPPDYGVPKTVRDKAWCADRDAFRSAVEVDLPQLAAGQPVQAAAIAGFLAGHESLVFAYEENAVPEAGSGPPIRSPGCGRPPIRPVSRIRDPSSRPKRRS